MNYHMYSVVSKMMLFQCSPPDKHVLPKIYFFFPANFCTCSTTPVCMCSSAHIVFFYYYYYLGVRTVRLICGFCAGGRHRCWGRASERSWSWQMSTRLLRLIWRTTSPRDSKGLCGFTVSLCTWLVFFRCFTSQRTDSKLPCHTAGSKRHLDYVGLGVFSHTSTVLIDNGSLWGAPSFMRFLVVVSSIYFDQFSLATS